MAGKLDQPAISEALVNVLNDRVQHHHVLTLLDSLGDGLLDSQVVFCILTSMVGRYGRNMKRAKYQKSPNGIPKDIF